MGKSVFEQMGGTYREAGDDFIPNLSLPNTEERPNGIWGAGLRRRPLQSKSTDRADRRDQRRKRYLKEQHRVVYYNLLISGKSNASLADINEQAKELFSWFVNQHDEKGNVTEHLKADNAMAWVQRMLWRTK